MLAVSLIYLLTRSLRIDAAAVFLLSCVIVTIFFSEEIGVAVSKGFLWVLLFLVVGPLLAGLKVRVFRDLVWRWQKAAVLAVTILSFVWYVAGLLQYGKGVSGFTLHCMVLGPFAALAIIYAAVKAVNERSYKYALIAVVSLLTCLVSGSRSAVLGAVAGVASIPVLQLRSQALRWLCIFLIIVTALFARSWLSFDSLDGSPLFPGNSPLERYVAELQQKGLVNTREQLWETRWSEFNSSRAVGIGIGVDTSGGLKTEYGTITIEPGSSYLAMLSMTGLLGVLSFGVLMITLVMKFRKNWDFLGSVETTEIVAVGIFWAIHALVEGWVFAGGSIFCLFFWLWVGKLSNLGSPDFRRRANI